MYIKIFLFFQLFADFCFSQEVET